MGKLDTGTRKQSFPFLYLSPLTLKIRIPLEKTVTKLRQDKKTILFLLLPVFSTLKIRLLLENGEGDKKIILSLRFSVF